MVKQVKLFGSLQLCHCLFFLYATAAGVFGFILSRPARPSVRLRTEQRTVGLSLYIFLPIFLSLSLPLSRSPSLSPSLSLSSPLSLSLPFFLCLSRSTTFRRSSVGVSTTELATRSWLFRREQGEQECLVLSRLHNIQTLPRIFQTTNPGLQHQLMQGCIVPSSTAHNHSCANNSYNFQSYTQT